MQLQFNVPSIVDSSSATNIARTIQTADPEAQVEVDLELKTVRVETRDSEETMRQVITASGHKVD